MKFLAIYLIVFLILSPCFSYAEAPKALPFPNTPVSLDTAEGDQALNLKIIPPWTMLKCPKEFYATYTLEGAKELKKTDAACFLWQTRSTLLETQTATYTKVIEDLKKVVGTYEAERIEDEAHIKNLINELNIEIAEKNTYKYQPNYGWLYISIGAALAVAGIAFGVGVWIEKN